MRNKHPGPAPNRRSPIDPSGNTRFTPLQASSNDVKRALRTFPLGSSGGPDGLKPQHITDLLAGDTDGRFLTSLTELINLLLAGKFDTEINTIIYGGRLLAMSKKDGVVRPIAVGYTIRRLAAKCANRHVIEERSRVLQPRQVGVGVAGGAEAAVYAMRRYVKLLPVGHAIVKLH